MRDLDLSKIRKVYFIGIGGIGISALAKFAKSRGMEVSGVNDEESPATVLPLKEAGINVTLLRTVLKEVPKDGPFEIPEADLYVYSDAWLNRGPEIMDMAKNTGKPVLSYFETLGFFAKDYKVIAISGTHGKTTTTAMVADILIEADFDPTVIVGSFVKKFGSNFKAGKSEYLVVEADEYNRHMLYLNPYIGAITNIDIDHLDCYKDLDDIKSAFAQFLSQSENRVYDYEVYLDKVPKLSVLGEHNRKNAALAMAIADILGINEEISKKALQGFAGTWRRLEKRGITENGTIIYDDYAHHPTEIMASIEGLREAYKIGEKKITIVFQPHLYSRTKALFDDFAKCFKNVDKIILLPIYFAREVPDESISSGKLAEAICQNGGKAIAFTDFELAEQYLLGQTFGKDDILVTMGAGEAYKIADKVFKFK